MNNQFTIIDKVTGARDMTKLVLARKSVSAPFLQVLWAIALALLAFGAQAGVIFTNLHSFQVYPYGQIFPYGFAPPVGLTQGTDGYFYGTTWGGGTNGGSGTVFRIDTNGVLTSLYSFSGGYGTAGPNGLVEGRDGYFYGTTYGSGNYGDGAIFKISTNGTLTTLYSFSGGSDGDMPYGTLVQGPDGFLYGTTYYGGAYGDEDAGAGTVFKISTNGTLTTLYSFNGDNGGYPSAGLLQGSDGSFFGTTTGLGFGGPNGGGTVFKISTNGDLTTLYSFSGSEYSGYPDSGYPAGLVEGADGDFYGTTRGFGYGGYGTVFKINPNGVLTTLYSFTDGDDGSIPSGLVNGSDGYFYGTTLYGNSLGGGTVFRISSVGALTTLYAFTGGSDGEQPSGLAQGRDGNLYGTSGGDFPNGPPFGTVFKITTNGELATLFSLPGVNDGSEPNGLVQGSDGNFYGTTYVGNDYAFYDGMFYGYGTVFKVSDDGALTDLYSFPGGSKGAYPLAGLVQGSGGNFYGTTSAGGTNGAGTVFELSTNGAASSLYSFSGVDDGADPLAGLAEGNDGYFYGTTKYSGYSSSGGYVGYGTVFQISTNGVLTTLYSFTGGSDGTYPQAGLLLGRDGYLYGTTAGSGAVGDLGTVFRISTNGTFRSFYSFSGTNDGATPLAGLAEGTDGYFYGTASAGGSNDAGTLFKIDTNGAFTSLYSFAGGIDGGKPLAGLVEGSDSYFYGTTSGGGSNYVGTVFRISTNGTFSSLYSFTGGNGGSFPDSGLVEGSNDSFYGTTDRGGQGGAGTVFRISLVPDGSLQVTITPSAAVSAGAQWQVDDNAFLNSGAMSTGLSVGLHTVSFKVIPGWNTPSNQFVMITNGATTRVAGVYTVTAKEKPTLTITSPKSGQGVTATSNAFNVTGTTTDKESVTNISFQFNGGSWTMATSSNSWSNWTASVTLNPGLNTISAYAQDISGNLSSTNTVKFRFIPGATLTIRTNGLGSITPVDNGKLLAIGTNYTLTATSAKNWLFSNWVASGSESFVSNNPVLKFTMQSNLVLTANFVTNLFLAAQGAYHGLFAPTGSMREETNSGSFVLNLLSTGTFTGDLFLGSNTVSLAGKFGVSGYVQTNSTVKGGKPLTTILQLDVANQAVSGMVSDGSFVAQLDGDRNVFGSGHPATDYAGQYTWTIPGTNEVLVGPYGTSYGTITVSALGVITFAGNLADGTTVSQSSTVSKDGRWPMYLPSSNPNESVFGWNYFTNQTLTAPAFVSWINVTNKAKAAVYSSGFTNQQASIVASFYTATDKPLLSLAEAQVTLEEGDLPFGITNQITLAANNAISVPVTAGNTNKLKLTITPKTGLITGSFQNPVNAKQTITINGVLLQNQTNAQGFFLGTNQSGAFLLDIP